MSVRPYETLKWKVRTGSVLYSNRSAATIALNQMAQAGRFTKLAAPTALAFELRIALDQFEVTRIQPTALGRMIAS